MSDDPRHYGRQERGSEPGPIYTRLERERGFPGKKREWPGVPPERPVFGGGRGGGSSGAPSPGAPPFKRGRMDPMSPTARDFERGPPGWLGYFGAGRGGPAGPGPASGPGLSRRTPSGPPFLPERGRGSGFSPAGVNDGRPPFGRDGFGAPTFGRGGPGRDGSQWDPRPGAAPDSPSWRTGPGTSGVEGGAPLRRTSSGSASSLPPPPPPRLGGGAPGPPSAASSAVPSLPPGIADASKAPSNSGASPVGALSSAEIEAGEIPCDPPSLPTGRTVPASPGPSKPASSLGGWGRKPTSNAGTPMSLGVPFHRTASLPSVTSPVVSKLSGGPGLIPRKMSEASLLAEKDASLGHHQPGPSPKVDIATGLKPIPEVRLEPRRQLSPGDLGHIRLEPRKPVAASILGPALSADLSNLEPRGPKGDTPGGASADPSSATTATEPSLGGSNDQLSPDPSLLASSLLISTGRGDRSANGPLSPTCSDAADAKDGPQPKRKRLGWGQGLARRVKPPTTPLGSDQEGSKTAAATAAHSAAGASAPGEEEARSPTAGSAAQAEKECPGTSAPTPSASDAAAAAPPGPSAEMDGHLPAKAAPQAPLTGRTDGTEALTTQAALPLPASAENATSQPPTLPDDTSAPKESAPAAGPLPLPPQQQKAQRTSDPQAPTAMEAGGSGAQDPDGQPPKVAPALTSDASAKSPEAPTAGLVSVTSAEPGPALQSLDMDSIPGSADLQPKIESPFKACTGPLLQSVGPKLPASKSGEAATIGVAPPPPPVDAAAAPPVQQQKKPLIAEDPRVQRPALASAARPTSPGLPVAAFTPKPIRPAKPENPEPVAAPTLAAPLGQQVAGDGPDSKDAPTTPAVPGSKAPQSPTRLSRGVTDSTAGHQPPAPAAARRMSESSAAPPLASACAAPSRSQSFSSLETPSNKQPLGLPASLPPIVTKPMEVEEPLAAAPVSATPTAPSAKPEPPKPMDSNKQRKAEMFMRIEDVENDMEAIEKQLSAAKNELEAARLKLQSAEDQARELQNPPKLPEVSSDESDASSMSEDNIAEELHAGEDADRADEAEQNKCQAELEALAAKLKAVASQRQSEDALRHDAVKLVQEKQQAVKALQVPLTRPAASLAPTSKRRHYVSSTLDDNMRLAAAAEEGLNRLLPSAMVGAAKRPLEAAAKDRTQVAEALTGCNPYMKSLRTRPACPLDQTDLWIRNAETHSKIKDVLLKHLSDRSTGVKDKKLDLLRRYVMLSERHRAFMKAAQQTGGAPSKSASSKNLARSARASAVSSDYGEMQVITQLQAIEKLKTLVKAPPQMLCEKEKQSRALLTDSMLVEDPVAELEREQLVKMWTPEEKKLFLEKFQQYPKDFRRIASYLEHRSVGDCIRYFYENQKLDEFANYRRKKQLKKRRMYSDANKKKGYMVAGSQGGPQAQARAKEEADRRAREEEKIAKAARARAERAALRGSARAEAVAAAEFGLDDEDAAVAMPAPSSRANGGSQVEKKAKEGTEGPKKSKKSRDRGSKDGGAKSSALRTADGIEVVSSAQWTETDQVNFFQAFQEFGRNWKEVAARVGTKTEASCKSYFGKHRKRMGLEKVPGELDRTGSGEGSAGEGGRATSVGGGKHRDAIHELAEIAAEAQLMTDERMDDGSPTIDRKPEASRQEKAGSGAVKPRSAPRSRRPKRVSETAGVGMARGPQAPSEGAGRGRPGSGDVLEADADDQEMAEALAHMRAAEAAGLLPPGMPEAMALQIQKNVLQAMRDQRRSGTSRPPSDCGEQHHAAASRSSQPMPDMMAGGMLGPEASAAPSSQAQVQQQMLMQMAQGNIPPSMLAGLPISGLQQAAMAGQLSLQQLMQLGQMGIRLPPPGDHMPFHSNMFPPMHMLPPGMMQQLAGQQMMKNMGMMPPGLMGADLQMAMQHAAMQGRSSPERKPRGGPLGQGRPPSGRPLDGHNMSAIGSEAKVFGADLKAVGRTGSGEQDHHPPSHLGGKREPSPGGSQQEMSGSEGGREHPGSAPGSPMCSPRQNSPGSGRQSEGGPSRLPTQQQQAAWEPGMGAHFPGQHMAYHGAPPNRSKTPPGRNGSGASPSDWHPPPASLADMMRERVAADGRLEAAEREAHGREGEPGSRFREPSPTEKALLAAMLQQQNRMQGRRDLPPAMHAYSSEADMQKLLSSFANNGMPGRGGPDGPSRPREGPPEHRGGGSVSDAMHHFMQQQAAAGLAGMPCWPHGVPRPDASGRRSPSGMTFEEQHLHSRRIREMEAMAAAMEEQQRRVMHHRQRATGVPKEEDRPEPPGPHGMSSWAAAATAGWPPGRSGSGSSLHKSASASAVVAPDAHHHHYAEAAAMARDRELADALAARRDADMLAAAAAGHHPRQQGMSLPPGINPFSFNPGLASALGLGGGGGMHSAGDHGGRPESPRGGPDN
mmetsp:Transcript_2863/g.8019  ORF Transcript_2863/g.8019 Transcript_2863/m.8019 type:complete len:2412 (+) Transcript_2863:312-7547(+)